MVPPRSEYIGGSSKQRTSERASKQRGGTPCDFQDWRLAVVGDFDLDLGLHAVGVEAARAGDLRHELGQAAQSRQEGIVLDA